MPSNRIMWMFLSLQFKHIVNVQCSTTTDWFLTIFTFGYVCKQCHLTQCARNVLFCVACGVLTWIEHSQLFKVKFTLVYCNIGKENIKNRVYAKGTHLSFLKECFKDPSYIYFDFLLYKKLYQFRYTQPRHLRCNLEPRVTLFLL